MVAAVPPPSERRRMRSRDRGVLRRAPWLRRARLLERARESLREPCEPVPVGVLVVPRGIGIAADHLGDEEHDQPGEVPYRMTMRGIFHSDHCDAAGPLASVEAGTRVATAGPNRSPPRTTRGGSLPAHCLRPRRAGSARLVESSAPTTDGGLPWMRYPPAALVSPSASGLRSWRSSRSMSSKSPDPTAAAFAARARAPTSPPKPDWSEARTARCWACSSFMAARCWAPLPFRRANTGSRSCSSSTTWSSSAQRSIPIWMRSAPCSATSPFETCDAVSIMFRTISRSVSCCAMILWRRSAMLSIDVSHLFTFRNRAGRVALGCDQAPRCAQGLRAKPTPSARGTSLAPPAWRRIHAMTGQPHWIDLALVFLGFAAFAALWLCDRALSRRQPRG